MSEVSWRGVLEGAVIYGEPPTGEPLCLVYEPKHPEHFLGWSEALDIIDALGGYTWDSCIWRSHVTAEIDAGDPAADPWQRGRSQMALLARHERARAYTVRLSGSDDAVGWSFAQGPQPLHGLCHLIGDGCAWLTVQQALRRALPRELCQRQSALDSYDEQLVGRLAVQVNELWREWDYAAARDVLTVCCGSLAPQYLLRYTEEEKT